MRIDFLLRRAPFIAAAILTTASVSGCYARAREYYDPVYADRHRWDDREDAAYRRWEAERRVEHIEYERRNADEQRAYWNWRHAHPDDR